MTGDQRERIRESQIGERPVEIKGTERPEIVKRNPFIVFMVGLAQIHEQSGIQSYWEMETEYPTYLKSLLILCLNKQLDHSLLLSQSQSPPTTLQNFTYCSSICLPIVPSPLTLWGWTGRKFKPPYKTQTSLCRAAAFPSPGGSPAIRSLNKDLSFRVSTAV